MGEGLWCPEGAVKKKETAQVVSETCGQEDRCGEEHGMVSLGAASGPPEEPQPPILISYGNNVNTN